MSGGVTFIQGPPNIVVQARRNCRPEGAFGSRIADLGPDRLQQCSCNSRSLGPNAASSRGANWEQIGSADTVVGDQRHWAEVPHSSWKNSADSRHLPFRGDYCSEWTASRIGRHLGWARGCSH